jgi:hypothetical protein
VSKRAWLTPEERKARRKAQNAAYAARPDVKARNKARMAEYYAQPEVIARRKAYQAEYCARPEIKARIKARSALYRARPEIKLRIKAKTYGLSVQTVQELLVVGCVAALLNDAGHCSGKLHIDHDHGCCNGRRSCGRCVRGALCHKHNVDLGRYESTALWASKYLARHQHKQEGGRS